MKKQFLLLLLLCLSISAFGQRSPEHPMDIPQGNVDLFEVLEKWDVGTPPPQIDAFNDQFYISRVRPLPRIDEGDYQVAKLVDKNRKLCLWLPMDDPTTKWKSLPRYNFEGDNFSMWSYVNIHGNWTAPWMRVSSGITDVAHKNGVKVGCVLSIPYAVSVSDSQYNKYGKIFYRLFEKNSDGTFKYSEKLVKLMKYYGIDGLGCNSEFYTNTTFMKKLTLFVQDCHKKAKEIGWEFQLHWYDGTGDAGYITFDRGLGSHNDDIFGKGDNIVTDMLFFNYNWYESLLEKSVKKAEEMNRSSYDLYAGFDIQGKALKKNWSPLLDNKISIGFWGAHSQSLLHQSATDNGTSDIAIQKAYLLKQELVFSGGNRNPALTPKLRNDATLANSDLKTFHGLSTFLSAKSTLQQLPFVTRFSLGNGLFFNNQGKTTFNHKWYNISTQDFLPTWRWWITDKNDEVTEANLSKLIKADFVFTDAWFGGSCLKLHGKTDFSRLKLFKTKIKVSANNTLSLTYKTIKGVESKAKIFIAKQNKLTEYKEIALPNTKKENEWFTQTFKLSELGIVDNDVVAMIGLVVEKSTDEYGLLLGELALRDPDKTFNAVKPTITKVDILRGRHNQIDFKLFYKSKDESNGVKTYNDEVDTWYFEIFFQQKGEKEQLLTATTSWAGYVIDAPIIAQSERKGRFGVRAVSPNGNTGSAISWTDYMDIPYNDPVHKVVIDKPIVKPNEEFTIKFEDILHTPAKKWEVKNPLTDKVIASATNSKSLTTSISEIGLYDLYLTDDANNTTLTRGFIQITREETGAVPKVLTLTPSKNPIAVEEVVKYTYTSRDGQGNVSRALQISDPNMFRIPAKAQEGDEYSYALWFKAEKFSHDKQGTNLINKNTIADKWPHNNWGDIWVTIRPKWKNHNVNEISFNTMGWTAHDIPNEKVMTTDYSVTPNIWNHVVVTQNSAKVQKIYFNGKKIAENTFTNSRRREEMTDIRIDKTVPADIYIGGGNVYKSGLNGWIDEVQIWNKALTDKEVIECMKGYKSAPAGLIAYYTFEQKEGNSSFANKGNGGENLKGQLVKMVGSGGESTVSASYVEVPANNDVTGQPNILGSLPITTKAKWILSGANTEKIKTVNDKSVECQYAKKGTYNVGVVLENQWAKDNFMKKDFIIVKVKSAVNTIKEEPIMVIYPNPFIEKLNVQFIKSGNFTIEIINVNGQIVLSNEVKAYKDEILTFDTNIPPGTYLVNIKENNQLLKSLKVIRK